MRRAPPSAAHEVREDVLSVVSHDLRGPLGAIQVAVEALATTEVSAEQRSRYLRIIRQSTERAARAIQDFLDVTQIEDHSLPVERTAVPAGALLAQVASDCAAAAESYRMTVEVRGAGAPELLHVDRERMSQALSHLVRYSLQHARGRGPIEISAGETEAGVVLAVRDHGPGLSDEVKAALFQRFWESRPRAGGGALGLAIARGIAEAHGGEIRAANDPDGGVRFEIVIPNGSVGASRA